MPKRLRHGLVRPAALFCFIALGVAAQTPADLQAEMRALAAQLQQLRDELAASRRESGELRRQVDALRGEMDAQKRVAAAAAPVIPEKEEQEMLAAKVEEQHQTKVESGSHNRVRLSGLALMTAGLTRGAVDSLDVPEVAAGRLPGDSNGALAGSIRQSILSLSVDGPVLAGAKTHGEISADFFGGLPDMPDGATLGLMRLRTAKLTLDWANCTVEAGQEAPFLSPRSPSSLVSQAYPALASAGNLWAWIPQVHAEHRFVAGSTKWQVQYGVLDPVTGEYPASEYDRTPTAGERNRTPAVAFRLGASQATGERRAAGAVGVYHSRQHWGFRRRLNSWAVTADGELPLGRQWTLSGEAYRGRAIGGLGGGASSTILLSGDLASVATVVRGVDSAGGWLQMKYQPVARWEFNAAFGGDYPFRVAPGLTALPGYEETRPRRNASGFGNVIYQPRTNLQFSVEYRRLWTSPFGGVAHRAQHASVGAGILF